MKSMYGWTRKRRGNCYVTSEALYHLLGGSRNGWTPMYMKVGRETHWFLKHRTGLILDATRKQFKKKKMIYNLAVGCGFLTKRPSRKARNLMEHLVYQPCKDLEKASRLLNRKTAK